MWTYDLGRFVLRVALGALMLLHGVAKVQKGVGGIAENLAGKGLPEQLAYGVYVGEVVAPILLIVGLFARPAAVILAVNMVVAVALVHGGDLLKLGKGGGWALELQALYFFGAVAVALLGPGRFAIGPGARR